MKANLIHQLLGTCVIFVLLCGASASGEPVLWPLEEGGNGHFYERVAVQGGCTWAQAADLASASQWEGMTGHLVTITSLPEHEWIWNMLGGVDYYWAGGFQLQGEAEPDGGWCWVTGEEWDYVNWLTGEPNNVTSNVDGHEDKLQIGRDDQAGCWNDLWPSASIPGYVVEFEAEPISSRNITWGQAKKLFGY